MATDPFFAGNADVLKTYEFDYDSIIKFVRDSVESNMIGNIIVPPCLILACIQHQACGIQNIEDRARAQHLALTKDGIKYVVGKTPGDCRMECEERGKTSQTVPYDKMTDCDIEEPAGSVGCCCALVPRTLYDIKIDTAGGGQTLHVIGLKDPEQFKKDVWAGARLLAYLT